MVTQLRGFFRESLKDRWVLPCFLFFLGGLLAVLLVGVPPLIDLGDHGITWTRGGLLLAFVSLLFLIDAFAMQSNNRRLFGIVAIAVVFLVVILMMWLLTRGVTTIWFIVFGAVHVVLLVLGDNQAHLGKYFVRVLGALNLVISGLWFVVFT